MAVNSIERFRFQFAWLTRRWTSIGFYLLRVAMPHFITVAIGITAVSMPLVASPLEDLTQAAYVCDEVKVRQLIASGLDPNMPDEKGSLVLASAVTSNYNLHSCLQTLGINSSLLNSQELETTGCRIFAESRKSLVQFLLDSGADAGARSNSGWTPLLSAVSAGEVCDLKDVVQLLLAAGADSNADYTNEYGTSRPLEFAAEEGFASYVELLLDNGADPNWRNGDGITPLMIIALMERPELRTGSNLLIGGACDSSNENVQKFEILSRASDLSLTTPKGEEYGALTVPEILRKRLETGDHYGQLGRRCLELMLSAIN